jgi:hypothetical protein
MTFTIEDTYDAEGVGAGAIYACYTDPSTWHVWGHNTSGARARTRVEEGAIVDVKVRRYPWTYAVRILEAVPDQRVVCEVKPIGVRLVQWYEVEPIENGTRIHHAITVRGPLERGYSLLAGQYTKLLARETRALAAYVQQGRT